MISYIFTALFIVLVGWYAHIFKNTSFEIIFLVITAVFMPVVSVLGDLFFSGIKRYLNIKDFSNLLPGHGGAADRLDAMSSVMFVFILLFIIF